MKSRTRWCQRETGMVPSWCVSASYRVGGCERSKEFEEVPARRVLAERNGTGRKRGRVGEGLAVTALSCLTMVWGDDLGGCP